MKQPKKLTRDQKIKLSRNGHNPKEYMLLMEEGDTFTAIAKAPNKHGIHNTVTLSK